MVYIINLEKYGFGVNTTFIYFVESSDGYVKIGRARDPFWRLKTIQMHNPHSLKIKLVIKGHTRIERLLQNIFEDYLIHGEWFKNEGLLKQFLDNSNFITLVFPDLYFEDLKINSTSFYEDLIQQKEGT